MFRLEINNSQSSQEFLFGTLKEVLTIAIDYYANRGYNCIVTSNETGEIIAILENDAIPYISYSCEYII